jgi:predicted RNA-binding protein with TRAM domain
LKWLNTPLTSGGSGDNSLTGYVVITAHIDPYENTPIISSIPAIVDLNSIYSKN